MEQLILSFSNQKFIAFFIAFIVVVLETFLPLLPLLAIVMANSFVLGMWQGFFVSWIGSSIASIMLYYVANKFSKLKFIKLQTSKPKVKKIVNWIKSQGFNSIFISYSCPFIPDFLITVTSGFTSLNVKEYVLGMISGKFVMFLLISYVGDDILEIFNNPIKIIYISIAILFSWFVGQKINKEINNN